jgi:hypothetical protein
MLPYKTCNIFIIFPEEAREVIALLCSLEQVWHNHQLGYNIPYGGQSPISVPLFTYQMGVKIRETSIACIFEHGASCQVA